MIFNPFYSTNPITRAIDALIDTALLAWPEGEGSWPKNSHKIEMWMDALTLLIVIVMMCQGCAPSMQGACRHEALYAASVCAESYPARIAMGPPGHAQAQCYIGGEWRWIGRQGNVVTVRPQDNFSPEWTATLPEYIEVMKGNYPWKGEKK